jgi:hypothetical protein
VLCSFAERKKNKAKKQTSNMCCCKKGDPDTRGFDRDPDGNFAIDTESRKCTDLLCVLVFIVFWIGFIAVGAMAALGGDRYVVSNGFQIDGRICGLKEDATPHKGAGVDFDKVILPGPLWASETATWSTTATNYTVCTDKCPDKKGALFNVNLYDSKTKKMTVKKMRAVYSTKLVTVGTLKTCFYQTNGTAHTATLQDAINGVVDAAPGIAIGAVVCILMIGVFFVIVRKCMGFLIWTAISLVAIGLLGMAGIFFQSSTNEDHSADQQNSYRSFGIIMIVLFVIYCAVMCFLRSRIKFAIMMMEEVTHALEDMKTMFLLPPFKFLVIAIFYILWIAIAGGLATAGKFQDAPNATALTETVNGKEWEVKPQEMAYDEGLQNAVYFHMFAAIWVNAFLIAMMNFMVASSFAQWYFAPRENGKKTLVKPVAEAFRLAWTKHIGTMVFGSLIVAIATAVKHIVDYMLEQAKKQSGNNRAVKLVACVMKCLTRCIESCLKYISTQAYIFTAIHGTNFWSSCVSLFKFISANPLRIGVAQSLGRIVVGLGRNFVLCFTMLITFLLMTYVEPMKTQINSPYLALFVVFAIAFVMCVVAFEVFGMGMDTLIMCFIADESMNDGAAVHSDRLRAKMDQMPGASTANPVKS